MDQSYPDDPTIAELMVISHMARIERMVADGLSPVEAARRATENETPEGYAARNADAMTALQERLMSPDYQDRLETIQNEPDLAKRALLNAELKRDNFRAIDMEAVHRAIGARNRQWKAEGVLPPGALI